MAYDDIIETASKQYQIPVNLIKAIIQVESNWKPNATRYEPKIKDTSYGLMQVLLGTGRMVANNSKLTAKQLIQPPVNILIGTKYLKQLSDRYKGKLEDIAAAYNAGKVYRRKLTGKYINQGYVDKVMRAFSGYNRSWGVVVAATTIILLAGRRLWKD